MAKIVDYKCVNENRIIVSPKVAEETGLSFPETYLHAETMAKLSLYLKEANKEYYAILPFCHTVEGEAFGGLVNLGNENVGPRASGYICESLEEVAKLKDIDFSKGRIAEVLKAIEILKDQGEKVMLEVSGPITVLNVLIDASQVFKGMRKKPELLKEIYAHIARNLLKFIDLAKERGADVISYADSAGAVNIVGPKLSEKFIDDFLYDFLKELEKRLDGDLIVHLCPKTTLQLIGTEKATFKEIDLGKAMEYAEAMDKVKTQAKFLGERCINTSKYMLNGGKIREVVLKSNL